MHRGVVLPNSVAVEKKTVTKVGGPSSGPSRMRHKLKLCVRAWGGAPRPPQKLQRLSHSVK